MIVHRRHWFYRLSGEGLAHPVEFDRPMTIELVRKALRRMLGVTPVEIWGR